MINLQSWTVAPNETVIQLKIKFQKRNIYLGTTIYIKFNLWKESDAILLLP